jgi:hypothetical protein
MLKINLAKVVPQGNVLCVAALYSYMWSTVNAAQLQIVLLLLPLQVAVLQAGRVGPEFFAALSRVRSIHEHCKGLLRSHHQRAGLELMDQMAAHQEAAYEHLCR